MTKMYDQTTGELCGKCGWSMKFPDEPCRCELERENAALREQKESLIRQRNDASKLYFTAQQVEIPALLRENAALHAELKKVCADNAKLAVLNVTELSALREDEKRLDWLEQYGWITGLNCDRAAIDAARKEGQP